MPNEEISLEVNDATLPAGPENLVWRAIDAMRNELKLGVGVHAQLEKRIPVARGLGGGSSDAAAALIGMMRLTKKNVPLERLMEIAAGLGADVPFFLFGGRALAVNRGDEIYPLPDAPQAIHRGRLAARHRREHERRLRMDFCGIDKSHGTP